MKAIPTVYNGTQYRSMLEARWAALFNLMGFRVQYEPEAFPGYIPDFMVPEHAYGHKGISHGFVIEVKGALEAFDLQKIRRAGWGTGQGCEDNNTSAAYGNILLVTGEGPAGMRHYWRSGLDTHSEEREGKGRLGLLWMLNAWHPTTSPWVWAWAARNGYDGQNPRGLEIDPSQLQDEAWTAAGEAVRWSPKSRPTARKVVVQGRVQTDFGPRACDTDLHFGSDEEIARAVGRDLATFK